MSSQASEGRITTKIRIHPAINFARFGNSPEYVLSPETAAGLPIDGSEVMGGLPIVPGAKERLVRSGDLRDGQGYLKRQAARFRLFAYSIGERDAYPNGGGQEIVVGTNLADGRSVKAIIWTVHLANKKANAHMIVPNKGAKVFDPGETPALRNAVVYGSQDSRNRLGQLVIDPGPRAITGRNAAPVGFDEEADANPPKPPTCSDRRGGISPLPNYTKWFPQYARSETLERLTSLGELRTDADGRLLVLGGVGKAVATRDDYGERMSLTNDLNNDGWFDDAADGPVTATVLFEDGTTEEAAGAWVVCTDPAYAPQIRNVVTAWDDVYDVWVRELCLVPALHGERGYDPAYRPAFASDIKPIFQATAMQKWTTNLPKVAVKAHDAVGKIDGASEPAKTIMAGLAFLRDPNRETEVTVGAPLMPLTLGDAGNPFLTVTHTQYFLLKQWSEGNFDQSAARALGPGEQLDMAALANCLGGRYVPGLEVSYPIRSSAIYASDWRTSGCGPFRIRVKPIDYSLAVASQPFLTSGWIPGLASGLEPGDLSKFMAVPWQADYNSCSIHPYTFNTNDYSGSGHPSTLYWSWPAQRPDSVYVARDVIGDVLPRQKWSIRGSGTHAYDPASSSTFQKPLDAVAKWHRIGVVIQGSQIDPSTRPEFFLEVQSQLDQPPTAEDQVETWPFNAIDY